IRNLLNLTSNLFDESKVRDYKDLADKIAYLRVQFVYQAGREPSVKDLVRKAEILAALKEINNKESLQRFCRYMEALVAYFRFYGGED
ncbi:MAG: type III-A CRISPR-associated protein Csm2, partial [Granulicatella sp.]